MSVQIFRDVEEALAREVRRITFDDQRTLTRTVLQDVFDPFTGELVKTPIQPSLYDSSADASNIQYPNFFIKLIKTREDRFSKREVPLYSNLDQVQVSNAPKAYSIVTEGIDGSISSPSSVLKTSIFNINLIQPNYLLRILNGNNIGTYIVNSITTNLGVPYSINLSSNLIVNLPNFLFDTLSRTILFSSPQDLSTIEIGDQFKDSIGNIFQITQVNANKGLIVIAGSINPNLNSGASIFRNGNVLKNSDTSSLRFLILDPSKPVIKPSLVGDSQATAQTLAFNWPVPLDVYYLIRIDSKERATHIDILNRMWEEFNPPRTGLPLVIRSKDSADENLTVDIPNGGSNIIQVNNNSVFSVGDPVFIIDDFNPTRDSNGNFSRPFTTEVISIAPNNQLILADIVPDTFKVSNNTKIVSNSDFKIWMFHFSDHNTRDVEGAQYWVHEFTFWVQIWVDRFGNPEEFNRITDIATPTGTIDGNIIIDDT
jgi:hypothetical protein